MKHSPIALNDQNRDADNFGTDHNQPLADDRFYRETYVADLTGQHEQSVRRARRADAAAGTPGERAPVPTWISERAVRYQGRAIKEWVAKRTADGQPAPDQHTA